MSFNFNGIATSKKYEKQIQLLSDIGITDAEKQHDTYFETASSSLGADNKDDIFITEVSKGTIVTFGSAFNIQELNLSSAIKADQVLKFIVSEVSMAFLIDYYSESIRKRFILNVLGHPMGDLGEPLEIESDTHDFTAMIFTLMRQVTGDNFYTIEPDHQSFRYTRKS